MMIGDKKRKENRIFFVFSLYNEDVNILLFKIKQNSFFKSCNA